MQLKVTRSEKSWLSILFLLGAAILAVLVILPYLPAKAVSPLPLADSRTLKILTNGDVLPVPTDDPHAEFHGALVTPPKVSDLVSAPARILGATTVDKHIEVDLTHQRLYAFEGSTKVYEFPVSTGKWYPTPTGTFYIWTKVKSTLMTGGDPSDGTYYYLPNVPWVEFFYNAKVAKSSGFSLHGTYWHNNFGHPMSHGCVNLRTADAKTLFDWTAPGVTNPLAWSTNATSEDPGTRIVIYGETPKE